MADTTTLASLLMMDIPKPYSPFMSNGMGLAGLLSPEARRFNNAADWMNMPQIPREAGAPGMKGLGYFGAIPQPDYSPRGDYSTELAANMDVNGRRLDFPLLVPTLSPQELQHLMSGGTPTDEIYRKAIAHAMMRGYGAKDTFATQYDLPVPLPK